jgi:hypothetical protein
MRVFMMILISGICGSLLGCSALPRRDRASTFPRNLFKDFEASEIDRIDVCRPTAAGHDDPRDCLCLLPVATPIADRETISSIHGYLATAEYFWDPDPGPMPLEYTKGPVDFLAFRDKTGRVLAVVVTYTRTVEIVPAFGRQGKVFVNIGANDLSDHLPEFCLAGHLDLLKEFYDHMKENQPDWVAIAHQKKLFPEVEDYLSLWDEILRGINDPDGVYCARCGRRLGDVTDETLPRCLCMPETTLSGKSEPTNGPPGKTKNQVDIGL